MIRCALPDNDIGYTIITTTRIADVAEQAGSAYKLKPLSSNNSRKLFFRRIFGNENKDNNEEIEKCPDDELAEVSDRILKKCAGVPLAIITTTRIFDVAEQAGGAHKLKPLSLNNSRKLFFRRIFGNKNKDNNEEIEKCPDDELAEVSDRILKKCAGVPLAIITMASLLACKARNKLEWYEVYNSIGTGMENNMDVENMRKILSFSYYELSCHLRT